MKTKTRLIAGLDEVGMGCLAGPVVVCVAAFPEGQTRIGGVRDSKKLSAKVREKLSTEIVDQSSFLGIGYAGASTINAVGISQAWQLAASMALENAPEFLVLVVDGDRAVKNFGGKQSVVPKADITHWEVSAASIVAKVMRDAHMEGLEKYYPDYGWSSNSGYGTQKHRDALLAMGPTPLHRSKFIRKIVGIS